jgi:hypothetical protein
MRKHNLHLERRQSWRVSTVPEFSRKAADVVGLYLNPPQKALVLCIDEKPCIQALERGARLDPLTQRSRTSGFAHEYKRHGTCWFSILSRSALQGSSFTSVRILDAGAMEAKNLPSRRGPPA